MPRLIKYGDQTRTTLSCYARMDLTWRTYFAILDHERNEQNEQGTGSNKEDASSDTGQ